MQQLKLTYYTVVNALCIITIRTPRPRPAIPAAQGAPLQLPPDSGLTPELAQRQAEQYKMVFDIFRQYNSKITNVTFWNISDRYSWLDFRGGGLAGGAAAGQSTSRTVRKAYPLLFDENYQRKKAYWSVVNF